MAIAASLRSEKNSVSAAPRRQTPDAAAQELAALRIALDEKLAALERALANPSQPAQSLETLVIDLARVATAEAEAAAAKACLDAQLEAERQTAARLEAQRALGAERDAAAVLRRDLEQARAAVQAERSVAAALRQDLATAEAALQSERDAALRLRRAAEESEAKCDAERTASAALRRDLEDARSAARAAQQAGGEISRSADEAHATLERERAVAAGLRQALADTEQQLRAIEAAAGEDSRRLQQQFEARLAGEQARRDELSAALDAATGELAAAREHAQRHATDLTTAQALIDQLEHQRARLERAAGEDRDRARSAIEERDVLAREMAALREAASAAASRADAGAGELEAQRAVHARAISELQARLDQIAVERDVLAADLSSARETLAAAASQPAGSSERGKDLERALAEAESRLNEARRDRDMMAEELELMRDSLASAQNESAAQIDQLHEAPARRIPELEAMLEERRRDVPAVTLARPLSPPARSGRADEGPPEQRMGTGAEAGPAQPPAVPPGSPVRRASRQAFHNDVQVLIDGNPATLVDLSTSGAQVISHAALKPNRMIRLQLPADDTPITCKGKVVWARLEASSTAGLRYRAGVFFTGVDEHAVETFMANAARR